AQVLVIGGGPSGSYAAAALAREGHDVVVLEAATFPRYHIGESLIPSVRHHLRFIDAEEKILAHGFAHKPGAAIKFNQYKKEGYTDFVALGHDNASWNVVRSEFDEILLDHAASCGARVFQSTKVTSISFAPASGASDLGRPTSATWIHSPPDDSAPCEGLCTGTIEFDYLIDASGRAGIMSTKYLKNRRFNESLKNVAMWGYWADTGIYAKGSSAEGAPWFEALTDESGWAWFIPLHNGTTSVGVVMNKDALSKHSRSRSTLGSPSPSPSSPTFGSFLWSGTPLTTRYLTALDLAPGVRKLVGRNGPIDSTTDRDETVRTASDYSYSAGTYGGEGWRVIGDAGAFIDPFFSSGVHLAMTSGLAAAVSISASIRGDCTEAEAAEWHSQRVAVSYTRFLIVVLSAYKQIRAQNMDVLSDVGEDNFDKAFAFIRPVIQGNADLGPRLSELEVQQALDFCTDLFSPTTPAQHAAVRARLESLRVHEAVDPGGRGVAPGMSPTVGDAALDVDAPVLAPAQLDEILRRVHPRTGRAGAGSFLREDAEEETRRVLSKINARRVIHRDHTGVHSLEEEALGGMAARLERGRLGLVRVGGERGAGVRVDEGEGEGV
ncbi:FAD/NAD(P)-binding domain-containing protein, partial [Dentipellis sp. KUC8613]